MKTMSRWVLQAASRRLFWVVPLMCCAALPAAAERSWSGTQLEERVSAELLRDGIGLRRLGYRLETTPAESGRWIVTLDTGAGEPQVRVLDGLPRQLEAAAAEVVLVVEQMLSREASVRPSNRPGAEANTLPGLESPRERRILAYARQRARIVRSDEVRLKASFWGRSVRGKVETQHSLTIGKDTVGHWEFAQRLAELRGEPVDAEMQVLYAPRIKRWYGLLIPGYIVGGVGTLGGISALVGNDACDESRPSFEAASCRNNRILGGVSAVVGAGILTGAVLYHINSDKALRRDAPYYSFDELTLLVAQYNRVLRQRLGLDDSIDRSLEAPAKEAEHTVRASPTTPSGSSPWPTVSLAPRFAALTWSF